MGIGAGLIALGAVSPFLGFVAFVYNVALVVIAARDLALLPGRSGYTVRRATPEPFSLGEPEEVTVVVENRAAAGLLARIADHAPDRLRPSPREIASTPQPFRHALPRFLRRDGRYPRSLFSFSP